MLVPQRRKDLKFLKTKAQIEEVRAVVFLVSAHLHGFDLQKRIALFHGDRFCGFNKLCADSLPVVFFENTHDRKLDGIPACFFEAKEPVRHAVFKGSDHDLVCAFANIVLPRLGNPEPFRQSFQDQPRDFASACRIVYCLDHMSFLRHDLMYSGMPYSSTPFSTNPSDFQKRTEASFSLFNS